jgi:hypothetical protein
MFEWPTVIIGIALGMAFGRLRRIANARFIVPAIVVTALTVTISSGEAERSWAYFGIDLLQIALGFAAAFALLREMHVVSSLRRRLDRDEP